MYHRMIYMYIGQGGISERFDGEFLAGGRRSGTALLSLWWWWRWWREVVGGGGCDDDDDDDVNDHLTDEFQVRRIIGS